MEEQFVDSSRFILNRSNVLKDIRGGKHIVILTYRDIRTCAMVPYDEYRAMKKAYIASKEQELVMEKNVEAIKEDVKAMMDENKSFHKRLLEIEASRSYEKPKCPKS